MTSKKNLYRHDTQIFFSIFWSPFFNSSQKTHSNCIQFVPDEENQSPTPQFSFDPNSENANLQEPLEIEDEDDDAGDVPEMFDEYGRRIKTQEEEIDDALKAELPNSSRYDWVIKRNKRISRRKENTVVGLKKQTKKLDI